MKKGYIVITILILMLVLVAIVYLYGDALFSELAIARNNRGAQVAFSLAEAGVQEAIYKVQYDTTVRSHFLAGTPDDSFTHDAPALLTRGSYQVAIENTAPGVATIISTGKYQIGASKTAQRVIKTLIAQGTTQQYTNTAGIYTSPAGGQSTGDIDIKGADVKIYGERVNGEIYGGGLASGKSLSIVKWQGVGSQVNIEGSSVTYNNTDPQDPGKPTIDNDSTLNYNCYIDSDPVPPNPPDLNLPDLCSSEYASHTPTPGAASEMPRIDSDAYKTQAKNSVPTQYFEKQADFDARFFLNPTRTSAEATGVVYVDNSLVIAADRTFKMNGVLISSGSISVGAPNETGQLIISRDGLGEHQPSGVVTLYSFNVKAGGIFSGTGLVYIGEQGEADFDPSFNPIELTGGILARRVSITRRPVIIHFNPTIINDTIGNPYDTPVIEINHWEEEY